MNDKVKVDCKAIARLNSCQIDADTRNDDRSRESIRQYVTER